APTDAADPAKPGSRLKTYPIKLEAGKTYSIQLNSDAFDAFLRLLDPAGKVVAEDDDGGGGLNARIDYRAPAAGTYRIAVTSFDGGLGPFRLLVLGDKGAPVIEPKPGGGAFVKPPASAAPTSYLLAVSSAGDYIGQGKTYKYSGDQLTVKLTDRGVNIDV